MLWMWELDEELVPDSQSVCYFLCFFLFLLLWSLFAVASSVTSSVMRWTTSTLHGKRLIKLTKKFITSKYPKLDRWNKTKIYPNPITYRGPFENKRNPNFTIPQLHFEVLTGRIRAIQNSQVTNPSPVHLVWRHQTICRRPWWDKVIMRRLGLHSAKNWERALVPNTPHFNRLLWQVKHLIRVKPLTFPDGIPTEKDIGAVKIEDHSGIVRISDQYRVPEHRLTGDKKPKIFEGPTMRTYMRRTIGIFMNNW